MSKIKLINFVLMFVIIVAFVTIYSGWKYSTEVGWGIPYSTDYLHGSKLQRVQSFLGRKGSGLARGFTHLSNSRLHKTNLR